MEEIKVRRECRKRREGIKNADIKLNFNGISN
jgi:hypothetical protein